MVADTIQAVIDTNVVFEGLTKQDGLAGGIIDAWLAGLFEAYASNALSYEYTDVLSRKLSPHRWQQLQPVLGALLNKTKYVNIHYSWRPVSPDPADDHIIDCAMNANAIIVTSNIRDFQKAQNMLGLVVMPPLEFIIELVKIEDEE